MPKDRQEKDIPPYPFQVWTTRKQSDIIWAFDEQHIRAMMAPKKPVKIKQLKEKPEKDIEPEPMGPPGSDVGRPAEYEPAFKILKAWVDSIGGPPEDVRKAIRIHWIDYEKVTKKK